MAENEIKKNAPVEAESEAPKKVSKKSTKKPTKKVTKKTTKKKKGSKGKKGKKKKNNKVLIIVLIAALILIIGAVTVVIVMLLGNKGPEGNKPTEVSSIVTSEEPYDNAFYDSKWPEAESSDIIPVDNNVYKLPLTGDTGK